MRPLRFEAALLIGGLAVLALLAYGRQSALERAAPASVYSTYDTGPNGYRALYETLGRAGVAVRRFTRVLPLLDRDVRTLVISGYESDPSARGLDAHDAAGLRRFVDGGGRLVVLDDDFAGKDDFTPGVGTSHRVAATAALALARSRYTAGVRRVRAPIRAAFGFTQPRGALPLLANGGGIVATAYRSGRGEVIAITSPGLFGNAYAGDADNAAFAYGVLSGHGPVAFDEYVHGYDDDLTFWQALPLPVKSAFWIACAIVVLALIGANVPFAPPIPGDAPDERDSSAYVRAMAGLLRRARAARAAVDAFAGDGLRRTRGRRTSPAVREALAELQRLRGQAHVSDAALLRAAVLDYRLRKEFP